MSAKERAAQQPTTTSISGAKTQITPAEAGYLSRVTGKTQEEIAAKVDIVEAIEPTGSYIEEVTGQAPPKEWLKEQTDTFKKLQKKREQEITLAKTATAAATRAAKAAADRAKKMKPVPRSQIKPVTVKDIQKGLGAVIKKIAEDKPAQVITTAIISAGLSTQAALAPILDGWAAMNDKLYAKGNFLTDKEKADFLEEVQKNPLLGYQVMTGVTAEKPPKTFDEALNRLNYMVSEMALGGIGREATLPFSIGAGQPRRMEDAVLQVIGGLLTPTPADYLVSTAFRALAGAGKKGTNILRKVLRGTTLNSDEALQFEKLVGQYGYSTSDLRKAGSNIGKFTQAEWDDFIIKYGEWYNYQKKFPNLQSAGAGYSRSALQEFSEILDDIDIDAGEYIDFLKANKLGPTLNPATLAAFTLGLKPPTSDLKAFEKIENEIEQLREARRLELEEAREKIKPKEPTEPGYIPPIEEEEQVLEPIVPGEPAPPEPPKPEEPAPPKPVPPKPLPKKRRGKGGGLPPNIFKALVGGISENYIIVFDYPKGKTETFTVKARSFPQALSQAQGLRRNRRHVPLEVDIRKTSRKTMTK